MQHSLGYDTNHFHSQHSTPPAHSYYGHLSHGSHGSYAPAQPVELPLSYPALQEMPASPSPGVAQFSAQMGLGQDQRLPTSLDLSSITLYHANVIPTISRRGGLFTTTTRQ